jgi:acyl carrier protein
MNRNDIIHEVKSYITEKLFRNGIPADFTNDTKLVSTRLLDSIVVLGLISHLEEKLDIELEAHEVSVDNLDTINIMADFLLQKLKK